MKKSKRPHILLVNIGFLPQVGGSYLSLFRFSRAFPPGTLCVLTTHARGEKQFDRKAGVPVKRSLTLTLMDENGEIPWLGYAPLYRSRIGKLILKISPLYYPVMALQFLRVIWEVRKGGYNLLWTGQAVPTGWIGWGIRKLLGIPYCTFVYGEDVTYFSERRMSPGKFLLLRTLRDADLIVANSDSTKKETMKLCRDGGILLKDERFPVITPGVDTDLFKPPEEVSPLEKNMEHGDREILVTVSRLTKQKGIDRVVRLMPMILRDFPRAQYLIRGDGPHKRELEKLVIDMRLTECVRFLEPVRYEDLPSTYLLGDVFVLPCRRDGETGQLEGFGTVFLEAAACGLPVIGSRSGGAAEAVDDGVTGFLIHESDNGLLLDRIIQLLGNKRLAREMGDMGRERVAKEFGWEKRSLELWKYMEMIHEQMRS
jgi:phosphatidylinositol alpha-1,6-mannosyltransferase